LFSSSGNESPGSRSFRNQYAYGETIMTTHKSTSVSHASHASHASKTKSAPSAASAAPEVAAPTTTPLEKTTIYVNPPPANATIPVPPAGSKNANRVDYRAMLPNSLELSTMPDVVAELARFTEYAAVFGKTAPALTFVEQTFDAATQWSANRVRTEAWDLYARSQEGASWSDVRSIIATLSPAFQLAVRSDATLARQFPAMVRLFDAKKVIAARGVATRKANKKAIAEGKPPTHGAVGKKAAKRAAKAALASAGAAAPGTASAVPAATVSPVNNAAGATVAHVATVAPAGATTGATS
jgi:hypothetical protein